MFGLEKDSRAGSKMKLTTAFLSRLPSLWEGCLGVLSVEMLIYFSFCHWIPSMAFPLLPEQWGKWEEIRTNSLRDRERRGNLKQFMGRSKNETAASHCAQEQWYIKTKKTPKTPFVDAGCGHMFQKLQQSEPWACYIPLVLKVEPGQHTDMSPYKGHWGASGNGVRDGTGSHCLWFFVELIAHIIGAVLVGSRVEQFCSGEIPVCVIPYCQLMYLNESFLLS